jgi:uncharacterized protein
MSWAVVTGASGGIGLEIVRTLAEQEPTIHFLLIARREEELQKIVSELKEKKVRAEYMVLDLAKPDSAKKIEDRIRGSGYAVRHLINNAGFGWWGRFDEQPLQNIDEMIALNITTLTVLTRRIIPLMETSGRIINVASSAGFAPMPGFAVYAATKAFVLSFSLALDTELRREREITVTAVCPGPVETGFAERARTAGIQPKSYWRERPETTARRALKGSARGRTLVTTGTAAAAFRFVSWLMPKKMVSRSVGNRMLKES